VLGESQAGDDCGKEDSRGGEKSKDEQEI